MQAALLAAWLLAAVPLTQMPVKDLLRAVDSRYNRLTTLQADFTEIYSAGLSGQSESGTLYLRKPGRMRWDYRNPDKLFLVDGHNVWLYIPGDSEVQRTSLKQSSDLRTPLRFLLGHTDLEQDLGNAAYGELDPLTPGDVVVHGVPVQLRDLYRQVWLEVTPDFDISRIVIGAVDGSTIDIRLSNIQTGVALPASLFKFTPPPGVHVVDVAGAGGQ